MPDGLREIALEVSRQHLSPEPCKPPTQPPPKPSDALRSVTPRKASFYEQMDGGHVYG